MEIRRIYMFNYFGISKRNSFDIYLDISGYQKPICPTTIKKKMALKN